MDSHLTGDVFRLHKLTSLIAGRIDGRLSPELIIFCRKRGGGLLVQHAIEPISVKDYALPITIGPLVKNIYDREKFPDQPEIVEGNFHGESILLLPVPNISSDQFLFLVYVSKISLLKWFLFKRWWHNQSRWLHEKFSIALKFEYMADQIEHESRSGEMLFNISEVTSTVIGMDFFKSLVKSVAKTLRVHHAFITECTDENKDRVRTLAMISSNEFVDNMEYDLTGTPCERVIQGEITYHPHHLSQFFPMHMGMEAYLGVPVRDSAGNVLGHMVVMDNKKMEIAESEISVIKIFANRAGLELERQRIHHELRAAKSKLEEKIEQRTRELSQSNLQLEREVRLKEESAVQLKNRIRIEKFISALSFRLLNKANESVFLEIQNSLDELSFLLGSPLLFFKVLKSNPDQDVFVSGEAKLQTGRLKSHIESIVDREINKSDTTSEFRDFLPEALFENESLSFEGEIEKIRVLPVAWEGDIAALFGIGMPPGYNLEGDDQHVVKIVSRLFYISLANYYRENALKKISVLAVSTSGNAFLKNILKWLRDMLDAHSVWIFEKDSESHRLKALMCTYPAELSRLNPQLNEMDAWGALYQNGVFKFMAESRDYFVVNRKNETIRFGACLARTIPGWHDEVWGHLAVFFEKKHIFSSWEEALTDLFIARIGSELMREKSFKMLEDAKHKAERANSEKSRFIANISHDLRTPLNSILGYSQILIKNHELEEEVLKKIQSILDSGKQLNQMINDLLDLAAVESGKILPVREKVELSELMEHMQVFYQPVAHMKNLELSIMDASPPKTVIWIDSDKLKRILMNVISNAIKYTQSGYVKIKMDVQILDSYHGLLHISISDSGSGIAGSELENIFHPFYQIDDVKNKREGSGLGLSIVREFVALLKGELKIDSEPGRGTTFFIQIPVEIATDGHEDIKWDTPLPDDNVLLKIRNKAELGDVKLLKQEMDALKSSHVDAYMFFKERLKKFDMDGIVSAIDKWRKEANGKKPV